MPLVQLQPGLPRSGYLKIEWYRLVNNMSVSELADASGVALRLIQRAESGEADVGNMTARNVLAIADALGVDIHDLM